MTLKTEINAKRLKILTPTKSGFLLFYNYLHFLENIFLAVACEELVTIVLDIVAF